MNILEKIAVHKRTEVESAKQRTSLRDLERMPLFSRPTFSLKESLESSSTGIITEFKRRSPSRPDIHLNALVKEIVPAYEEAGASGISILTDNTFFGGENKDVEQGRDLTSLPILRKDFILDEYQIVETKAMGADVLLLIAAILSPSEIKQFTATAQSLGLEVLLEVHSQDELLRNLHPNINLIGVNNRNLKTFEVDLENSKRILAEIPAEFPKIAESGLRQVSTVKELKSYGFNGFLMGENFMKEKEPGAAAKSFVQSLLQ